MGLTAANRAKRFLIDRIVEQAEQDKVLLADLEVRMLGFAEESASVEDKEMAARG